MTDLGQLRATALNFMCMALICLDEASEHEALAHLRKAIDLLMHTPTPLPVEDSD